MTALKIVLGIFGGLLLLSAVLLLLPVGIRFSSGGTGMPGVRLSYAGLCLLDTEKLKAAPPKKKKKTEKEPKKKSKKTEKKDFSGPADFFLSRLGLTRQDLDLPDVLEKEGIGALIRAACALLHSLFSSLASVASLVKLRRFSLQIFCAGENAAAAAMEYGVVCATVYPLYGALKNRFRMPKGARLDVFCPFDGASARIAGEIALCFPLLTLLLVPLRFLKKAKRTVPPALHPSISKNSEQEKPL